MSQLDLSSLSAMLESRVEDRAGGGGDESGIAGGVGGLAWAVSAGDQVWTGAAGRLGVRGDQPMQPDSIFRIASISKPIAAVAALQLVEAGLIGLDDPVDPWLPELADRQVLVDPTGPLDGETVPAERSLTLRDLLTSRCGLGMQFPLDIPQPVLDRMWELGIGPGPTPPNATPAEFMALLGELPLSDQPGTRLRYHTGIDIVSVLIERILGEGLDQVMARRIFEPLGMLDTGFWVPPDKLPRLGVTWRRGEDGTMAVWDQPEGRWAQPPEFNSGAAGLASTVADLVAFGRMLLRSGAGESGPVLSADLVADMTTDQLTDEQAREARLGDEEGLLGWGFGIGVFRRPGPQGWPPAGASTWDGGTGARFLIVPEPDLCAVLLLTDDFTSPEVPQLLDGFVAEVGRAVNAARD